MTKEQAEHVGEALKQGRLKRRLTGYQVADLAGVDQATVARLEAGQILNPRADKLARICKALKLPTADIFTMVGYTMPDDLPHLTLYLRRKYALLPRSEVEAINQFASDLALKYGVHLAGPGEGEDES